MLPCRVRSLLSYLLKWNLVWKLKNGSTARYIALHSAVFESMWSRFTLPVKCVPPVHRVLRPPTVNLELIQILKIRKQIIYPLQEPHSQSLYQVIFPSHSRNSHMLSFQRIYSFSWPQSLLPCASTYSHKYHYTVIISWGTIRSWYTIATPAHGKYIPTFPEHYQIIH